MKSPLLVTCLFTGMMLIGCTESPAPEPTSSGDAPQDSPSDVSKTKEKTDENGPSSEMGSGTNQNEGNESNATEKEPAAEGVMVEFATWDEVRSWVEKQKGKVVVIDVWSTFCLPCVKEFPHFVELHQQMGDQVATASLNINYYGGEGTSPEDAKSQIVQFLQSQNATMKNFISEDPDQRILQKISTSAIPASIVYDQQGELEKVFNNDENSYGKGGFNYEEHVTPLVKELLETGEE